MKRSTITLTALGFAFMAAAATGAAVAQQNQQGQPGSGPGWGMSAEQMAARHTEMFQVLDANGDGTVSQEEFTNRDAKKLQELREKYRAERRAAHFAALDADKNGTISQEEWKAAPQMAGRQGWKHGPGMMPGRMMDDDDMPHGMPGPGQGGGMGPKR